MSDADRQRWDARHRAAGPVRADGGFLAAQLEVTALLPERGRALDVACGRGAVTLWLAERGLQVTGLDISPVALEALARGAAASGVAVEMAVFDLDHGVLPAGPFDLICCLNYSQPGLTDALGARLAPGGVLVLEQHTVDNLARHDRPSRRYLAERGELARALLDAGEGAMRLEYYREGWIGDRALARAVARAVATSDGVVRIHE